MENQNKKTSDVQELLKSISKKGRRERDKVVYGKYDNRNASFVTKINDFLIDHSKISLKEKAYFFHLLSVMIDAGIPVVQSLKILANKTENRRFQRVINTLVYNTQSGKSLANSMAQFPDVFTEADIGVISAGEAAGNLNQMLTRLSEQTEKTHELQIKLITASTYPVVILITLIGVAVGMVLWIIPILTKLLSEGGLEEKDFPLATKALLGISAFISNYWWVTILGILIIIGIYRVYRSTSIGRFQTDYFILKIPIIGSLIRKVLVLRFVSLLGILIESGLPIIKTLEIVGRSVNNNLYQMKTYEVMNKVRAGERISQNLVDAPFLFPDTVSQMINIGETTASLGPISKKIAQHYDREIDHSLKRLTTLFEPIMILFVGLVVALLALAILMPIFDLTRVV